MTACLHWTPARERTVTLLAREIADHVREHRQRTGLSQKRYAVRHGFHRGWINQVECVRTPNFTLLTAIKLLELAGYTLRIVPKDPPTRQPTIPTESL